MDPSIHEHNLSAQLQADVQRGVRPDLDLWPAIRGQVAARRQAAARPHPAVPRRAVLASGLVLAVGLLVATLAFLTPPRPSPTTQTVILARPVVITDPRLAQTLDPPMVGNAYPSMRPPVQTLAVTITVTLEQVMLTGNEVQATLRIGLDPADSRVAAWAWQPDVTLTIPTQTVWLTAPPQALGAGRWAIRFLRSGLTVPPGWTLTVTRLTAPDLPDRVTASDLPGPWTFPLPARPAP